MKNAGITNVLHKAWEMFIVVRITEAADRVVMFDFVNEETREQIYYMSPRKVQGNCLSIKR